MKTLDLYVLAGKCLALDQHPEYKNEIEFTLKNKETRIEQFVFFCSNQYILPVIYLKFRNHKLLNLFQEEIRGHLKDIYILNVERNKAITQQIYEISAIFERHQIKPVFLKGTGHLIDNLYTDAGERMIGDIDLLVNDEHYLNAGRLVQELGYKTDHPIFSDVVNSKHYARLYKKDVPGDIEIHRLLTSHPYNRYISLNNLFADKKEIQNNIFVLSNTHSLLHNFMHCMLDDHSARFKKVRLRDMYDFYLLSQRISLESIIIDKRLQREFDIYMYLSQKLFHTDANETLAGKYTVRWFSNWVWFLAHPKVHRTYVLFQKIQVLVFHRYIHVMGQFFVNKDTRKGFFERLISDYTYKFLIYRVKNFYRNYVR
jgi:hypothetical protein